MNIYVRRPGKIVNFILVLAIFTFYGLELSEVIDILVSYELPIFIALKINNMIFLFYAIRLQHDFEQQIKIFHQRGIPLDSTDGFRYTSDAVDTTVKRSAILNFLIILGSILHFFPETNPRFDSPPFLFLSYFGIGLVLIAMSLFLRIDYPDQSLLEPGNFISYHKPKSSPTFLDNLLADSLKSFLDPRTRYQFDNWVLDIGHKLNPGFEAEQPRETRIERAIERLLLLLYLEKKVPYLLTADIFENHLKHIIQPDQIQAFTQGEESEIPLEIFSQLIERMLTDVPEIFKLVDRLLVEIMVNPSLFEHHDKIIETVIPDGDLLRLKEPFKVLIFVLNMSADYQKRIIEVIAETSRNIEPPLSKIKFLLDDPDPKILELIRSQQRDNGDLVYSDRIVDILSTMLQVGDTTWLQFIPQEYGNHVLNLAVQENEFQDYGASVPINIEFSLRSTLRNVFSSLTGILGAIFPIIKAIFITPLF